MPDNSVSVPNLRLSLNGADVPHNLMVASDEVTVEDEINLPAMFTIKFNIVDFKNGGWRGLDLKTFKQGDEMKIFIGRDDTVKMMTGEIASLNLTFGDYSFMEIRGYDRLQRLRFGTKRRSFKDIKDTDIASSIASEIGLSSQVEDTKIIYPYIFQNNQSNYEFLLERASRIGYEMFVDDKTFIFRKSKEDKPPNLTLQYGIDFQDLSLQLKTLTEGSEVEFRGWDIKNKKEIIAKVGKESETTTMAGNESGYELSQKAYGESAIAVVTQAVVDDTEAEILAKASYNTRLKEFITGEGTCSGNPQIRAGKTIEIKGIGDRFSGIYYVVATTHSISQEGYTTTFKVRRTAV